MTPINMHVYPVTEQSYDTLPGCNFGEIAVLKRLRYGLTSCHRSLPSLGGQGLSSALTGDRPALSINLITSRNAARPLFYNAFERMGRFFRLIARFLRRTICSCPATTVST